MILVLALIGGPVLLASVGLLVAGGGVGTVDPDQTIAMPILTMDIAGQPIPCVPDAGREFRTALQSAHRTLATARHRAPARQGHTLRNALKALGRPGGTRRAPDRQKPETPRPAEQVAGGEK